MDAPVILHPWPRQTAPRRDEAVDTALWTLVPPNVEGRELREELATKLAMTVSVKAWTASGGPAEHTCGLR